MNNNLMMNSSNQSGGDYIPEMYGQDMISTINKSVNEGGTSDDVKPLDRNDLGIPSFSNTLTETPNVNLLNQNGVVTSNSENSEIASVENTNLPFNGNLETQSMPSTAPVFGNQELLHPELNISNPNSTSNVQNSNSYLNVNVPTNSGSALVNAYQSSLPITSPADFTFIPLRGTVNSSSMDYSTLESNTMVNQGVSETMPNPVPNVPVIEPSSIFGTSIGQNPVGVEPSIVQQNLDTNPSNYSFVDNSMLESNTMVNQGVSETMPNPVPNASVIEPSSIFGTSIGQNPVGVEPSIVQQNLDALFPSANETNNNPQ